MTPTTLDLRGEVCPYTFLRTKLAIEELEPGAELELLLDHRPAFTNVPASLTEDGHQVLAVQEDPNLPLCRVRVVVGSGLP